VEVGPCVLYIPITHQVEVFASMSEIHVHMVKVRFLSAWGIRMIRQSDTTRPASKLQIGILTFFGRHKTKAKWAKTLPGIFSGLEDRDHVQLQYCTFHPILT